MNITMGTLEIVAGSLLILSSIIIIIAVSLQSNKGGGLTSAIMGGEGPGGRERGKSSDAKLATLTKWLAVVFFVVSLAVNIIALIAKKGA